MLFVDANVFIYAAFESGEEAVKSKQILKKISSGEENAITSSLVIDEVAWVFHKNNKKSLLRQALEKIYLIPNLQVLPVSSNAPLTALGYMEKYGLKPRDALHCAVMQENGVKTICSFDADFDKVKEIKRMEP